MSDAIARADAETRRNTGAPKTTFEMPKFEIPAAIRDLAEKGVIQVKENYHTLKIATDQATSMFQASYSSAIKGATEYSCKIFDVTRANSNAGFDFMGKLVAIKSPSEAVELLTAHTRQQFDLASTQGNELWTLAQKVATEVTEPIRTGMPKALQ